MDNSLKVVNPLFGSLAAEYGSEALRVEDLLIGFGRPQVLYVLSWEAQPGREGRVSLGSQLVEAEGRSLSGDSGAAAKLTLRAVVLTAPSESLGGDQ